MPQYPGGTVAFLFTDIEGSTRRWETQRTAMWVAVERHFDLLRDAITAHDGVLFKTVGDAVQAAFPTVPLAVGAAIAGQMALREEDWGDLGPLRVRMAIHAGDAIPRDGDYLAPALNRLARVLAAGYGGQILLTETAHALLGNALPAEHALRDLGAHRLKDLLLAEHIYQLAGPGLATDFPPLKSLQRQPHNLPTQPTALIGRDTEIASLREALASPGPRLITLTGPGGVGKTRLALHAAADSLEQFPEGVWWVPLAGIADPALLPAAIADPLGVREAPGQPLLETIADYLRPRRTLLLLDNLEHLPAAAPPIARLLEAAPELRVLATSRAPLHLRAEREFPVSPLPLPTSATTLSPAAALDSPAVRLFVERAQAVAPDFRLDAATASAVAAICRRLDGLPLAIELAAARSRLLPPQALLARLERTLPLLTGGARDLPERQRTLRATIAWSHDLLQPPEQTLFARLSVFAGGCTLEAMDAVCGDDAAKGIALLDQVASLVEQSLVRRDLHGDGDPRFSLLETIREFGQERLQESGEADAVWSRHAAFYRAVAERAEPLLSGPEQGQWLQRLALEHDNLRAALRTSERLLSPDDHLQVAGALWRFWWVRGHLSEGRQWLDTALARRQEGAAIAPEVLARALDGAGVLAEAQGDVERAAALHEEALPLWTLAGDRLGEARSLENLGIIELYGRGNLTRAKELHEAALARFRDLDDRQGIATALANLGDIALKSEDFARASALYEEALAMARELSDVRGIAASLTNSGALAFFQGDFARAAALYEEALAYWRALDDLPGTALVLGNLAVALHLGGEISRAKPLYEESLTLARDLGDKQGIAFAWSHLARVARHEGDARRAATLASDAAALAAEIGDMMVFAESIDGLAAALLDLDEPALAAEFFGAADAMRDAVGMSLPAVHHPARERDLESGRAALGSDRFQERYQAGLAMDPPQIDRLIARAVNAAGLQRSAGHGSRRSPSELAPREPARSD